MLQVLQAGRGLAALSVAAFHLSIGLEDKRYLGINVFGQYTWWGGVGVDFFFVLSGFIIMMAHEKDVGFKDKFRVFFLKRFVRIYPIYWLYTSVLAILLAFGLGSVKTLPDSASHWISMYSLIKINDLEPILAPAWTLFHEISFYILFSVLIFSFRIGAFLLLTWSLLCALFLIYAEPGNRTAFNTYFSGYNLNFIIGIIGFLLWKKCGALAALALSLIGITSAIAAIYMVGQNGSSAILSLTLGLALGGTIIGLSALERDFGLRRLPIIGLLGDASYSIYLTHEAIMGLLMKIFVASLKWVTFTPEQIYFLVLIPSIIGGCVAYLILERPLTAYLRRVLISERVFVRHAEPRPTNA